MSHKRFLRMESKQLTVGIEKYSLVMPSSLVEAHGRAHKDEVTVLLDFANPEPQPNAWVQVPQDVDEDSEEAPLMGVCISGNSRVTNDKFSCWLSKDVDSPKRLRQNFNTAMTIIGWMRDEIPNPRPPNRLVIRTGIPVLVERKADKKATNRAWYERSKAKETPEQRRRRLDLSEATRKARVSNMLPDEKKVYDEHKAALVRKRYHKGKQAEGKKRKVEEIDADSESTSPPGVKRAK
ncbi:MAG: hypothetical protein M1836_001916 [Candelina mexicana]|nr:MAG: hypothetical protein M1836_001916 [Candelina mexicana]